MDRVVKTTERGCIVGFAGRIADGVNVVSSICDGQDEDCVYNCDFRGNDELPVLTCDECFIAMSRETSKMIGGFDHKNFDGWHLCGVNLTLRAAERNILVVVVQVDAWHCSHGNMDQNFDKYKNVIRKKYRNEYRRIYYPCGWMYKNPFEFYSRL